MARTRTVRALATLAAVPLLLGVAGGAAQAAGLTSAFVPVGNVGSVGSGVGADNLGNVTTTQQSANGLGASNESNTASVDGSPFTSIDQSDAVVNLFWGSAVR
jgi:hypothetical protein